MGSKSSGGDTDVEVNHKVSPMPSTDGGKDGSHDSSHKKLGGARGRIDTGHPDELAAYHRGGK